MTDKINIYMLALLRRVNNVFCRLCCLVVPEMGSGGWCHFSCARGAMWTGELEPRHGCEYSLKMVTWIWSEDGKGFPHSCPISGAWSNHSDNCCLPCLPYNELHRSKLKFKAKTWPNNLHIFLSYLLLLPSSWLLGWNGRGGQWFGLRYQTI